MSLRHLSKGSLCPKLQNGMLRIYSMRFCPYAQRTLLVLNAKNVKHEVVNIHLRDKPEWFLEKFPLGKVPALEKDGQIIYESLVTCDFLDTCYPSPPLYSSDIWARYYEKSLIEVFHRKVITTMHRIVYSATDTSAVASLVEDLKDGLQMFEDELDKRGSKVFGGNSPGMLDYAIWPWFERFSLISYVTSDSSLNVLPVEKFPQLNSFMEEMKNDKAVKATQTSVENHIQYLASSLAKNPNYDLGLEEQDSNENSKLS